jgi:hypothetical protein
LGGEVTFGYCQKEGGDIPCPRILICWQPYFPVEAYLREKLTSDQWDRCFNQEPKQKVLSLLELIDEAKKRLETET